MKVEDLSFHTPEENLAYDETLLQWAEQGKGGEVFRLWESNVFFVVLGRSCKEDEDVFVEECQKRGIAILRRSSGGGTVLQGPGCLNFSLILSKEWRPELNAILDSYQVVLQKVQQALHSIHIDSVFQPICDLVWAKNGKKFSGNAQKRSRKYVLHHGTILYDFDISLVSHCLKMPVKMPLYRQQKSHQDFITNLPIKGDDIKKALIKEFLDY